MSQDKIIKMAQKLIAIPSTADNLPALQDAINFISNYLSKTKNITVEKYESKGKPSILAYAGAKRPKKFTILLNGHIDVVPSKPQGYLARVEGDKLYGRGAYDMKLAAVIMAVVFAENAQTAPKTIGLQIVTDEEVGGFDGAYHQLKQGIPKADIIIAGEMTDLQICNETRGICWAEVNFIGTKAHSAYAWDGKNALASANDFVQQLLKIMPVPNKTSWTTTANISAISTSNTVYNLVPDDAQVCIDFRFTPEDTRFASRKSVCKFIKSIAPNAECAKIKLMSPAVEVLPTNPALRGLMNAFQKATSREPELIKRYGSSDARHYAEFGQNCIEFGLSGHGLHSDNEYALISSIAPFKSTLETFIQGN